MDQKVYDRLTRACDIVLKRFSENYAIIAISWLHVLNGHPNSLQHYQYGIKKRGYFSMLCFTIYNIGYIFYKLFKSVLESRTTHTNFSSNVDILFISHLVNTDVNKDNSDFYFGELPIHAELEKGYSCVIGLIDHTSIPKTKFNKNQIAQNNPSRYLFGKTLLIKEELKLIRLCFSSFFRLFAAARIEKDLDSKLVLSEAAFRALSPDTFYTLRIGENIKSLIKKTNPNHLVFTWEGRAWERLAVFASRNHLPKIKSIGYQHTILLPSSHSIKTSFGTDYDPDCILTLGEITNTILQESQEFKQTLFQRFGSHRLHLSNTNNFKKLPVTICLVAPEGIESESVLLFNFAIEIAVKNPEMQFVFRTHPVLPFSVLKDKHKQFMLLPSNCFVSDKLSINDDFKRCNYLLYRGSSVAIYAVINGLKPVYFRLNDEISIDSLYFLGSWRSVLQQGDEFEKMILADEFAGMAQNEKLCDEAQRFCYKYVSTPEEAAFFNILSSKQ